MNREKKHFPILEAARDAYKKEAEEKSKPQHAPEPWNADLAKPNIIISEIDWERACACVNAMAGIPYPAAFMEVVRHLELDAFQKMKEQRDELLEYIRTALSNIESDHIDAAAAVLESAINQSKKGES